MENQVWHKLKNSLWLNIILLVLTGFLAYSAFNMILVESRLSKETTVAENKIAALKEKNQALQAKIVELDTPQAVEREAKDHLNLKMSGEEVVVVVPEQDQALPSAPHRFWDFIKKLFKF